MSVFPFLYFSFISLLFPSSARVISLVFSFFGLFPSPPSRYHCFCIRTSDLSPLYVYIMYIFCMNLYSR